MIRHFAITLFAAFVAVSSLWAQTNESVWSSEIAKLDQMLKDAPDTAQPFVEQLLKGKNKKDVALQLAVGRSYLNAGMPDKADTFRQSAQKLDNKNADVYLLAGDIALAKNDVGTACQAYDQAIYFNPQCVEAYFRYATVYKRSNPQMVIAKLEELKALVPDNLSVDKELADVYYSSNRLRQALEIYPRFIHTDVATEEDLTKYAFSLFFNHNFEQSLEIVNKGLAQNADNMTFRRLALYNYVDLKQYDRALEVAAKFFADCPEAELSSLDYRYHGTLYHQLKQYDKAVEQYHKALTADETKTDLWKSISEAYADGERYGEAIEAYRTYRESLPEEERSLDVDFRLGKLYYAEGTSSDTLVVTPEQRREALRQADSVFAVVAEKAPDSHLGNFWRARTNSALDPETADGLAKPYYEAVIETLLKKDDPRYNSVLIECYSYLGYYYLVVENYDESKNYWNKILVLDPDHAVAKRALEGIK